MDNIREFFREFGIQYREYGEHHHATHGRIQIDCPWCTDKGEERFRLGWHLSDRYFNCWKCGPVRAVDTFIEITGEAPGNIKKLLKGILPEDFEKRRTSGRVKIPETVDNLKVSHIKYLRRRGFPNIDELEQKWGIKGINWEDERLAHRIWIPVYFDNEIVTWTTRSISDNGQRYLSAGLEESKFNIKELLYGEDHCSPGRSILVVEAPISVWKVGAGCVALCGLSYSRAQVYKLSKYPTRYICLDTEEEEKKREDTQEIAEELAHDLDVLGGETHLIELETGKDPGECKDWELKKLKGLLQ